jgi:hypothetical protein
MIGFSEDVKVDSRHAAVSHTEGARRAKRKVKDAAVHERAAVVDGDRNAATRLRIRNPQARSEWQRAMRGRESGGIEGPAGGKLLTLPVIGG